MTAEYSFFFVVFISFSTHLYDKHIYILATYVFILNTNYDECASFEYEKQNNELILCEDEN